MKKLISLFMALLMVAGVVNALVLSNPIPTDGSTIPGEVQTFSIDGDVAMVNGWAYINIWGTNYPLVCAGLTCSGNVDLSSLADMSTNDYWFLVDGTPSSTYQFSIDRVPLTPDSFDVNGYSESELKLTWNPVLTMPDFDRYEIYRSDVSGGPQTLVATLTNLGDSSSIDSGLTIGEDYFYILRTYDGIGQYIDTAEESAIVQDMTAPTLVSINPPTGTLFDTITPDIDIDYDEDVTLEIWSGSVLYENFGGISGTHFDWIPTLAPNTKYGFELRATDMWGNGPTLTSYELTTTADADITIDIVDLVHLTSTATTVKGSAIPGSGYILIKYNLSMYGGNSVRLKMDDLVGVSGNIEINEESQPTLFCGEDYNSATQNIVASPSVTPYNVDNSYDEIGQPALKCADQDTSGLVGFSVYLKVPIPSDTKVDSYSTTVDIGMYDTP